MFTTGAAEIAGRILHLHQVLGHSRQIPQMDVGGMPHATFLESRSSARNSGSGTAGGHGSPPRCGTVVVLF